MMIIPYNEYSQEKRAVPALLRSNKVLGTRLQSLIAQAGEVLIIMASALVLQLCFPEELLRS